MKRFNIVPYVKTRAHNHSNGSTVPTDASATTVHLDEVLEGCGMTMTELANRVGQTAPLVGVLKWGQQVEVVERGAISHASRLDEMGTAGSDGHQEHNSPSSVARRLISPLLHEMTTRDSALFVGLDGRSGAGKSTLADTVARDLRRGESDAPTVTVIEGDQFYAGGSAASWDSRSPEEKAGQVIDWRRQRSVLQDLRQRGSAEWHPFDWKADDWEAESSPLARRPTRSTAAPVVLLEGAYSCRPELHDLLDLLVLLEIPHDDRRRQLLEREGEEYRSDWEARWSSAEDHYFQHMMPPQRFDLVLGADPLDG